MTFDPRIDALQDLSVRLRGGASTIRKDLVRDASGRPVAIEERPFNPSALIKNARDLTRSLSSATLSNDDAIGAGVAFLDFTVAAEPYVSGSDRSRLLAMGQDTRRKLEDLGVEL